MIAPPKPERSADIARLHQEGHLAVHVTSQPEFFYEKIDDPRILNNLREDGGTEDRNANHQFYTIVSATVLPPASYPIEQRIYDRAGHIFVGIDIENTVVKDFGVVDSQSSYHYTNKRGRPSYAAVSFHQELSTVSQEKRLPLVDQYNHATAQAVLMPTGDEDDIFGVQPPSYIRFMNEALLKVYNQSMVCLGTPASRIKEDPSVLLDLLYLQHRIQKISGITYPIYVYNNSTKSLSLDTIESEPKALVPNQLYEMNAEHVLKQMMTKYPDEITLATMCVFDKGLNSRYKMQDFLNLIEYRSPAAQQDIASFRERYLPKIEAASNSLNKLLVPFQESDEIIQIHHPDDPKHGQYPEINQAKLGAFIKRVLGFPENHTMTGDEQKQFKDLMKAYNLQFRLQVYQDSLRQGSHLNYQNVDKDLAWSTRLQPRITAMQEKFQPPSINSTRLRM